MGLCYKYNNYNESHSEFIFHHSNFTINNNITDYIYKNSDNEGRKEKIKNIFISFILITNLIIKKLKIMQQNRLI